MSPKKLLAVFLALCLCFPLIACGLGGNQADSEEDDTLYTTEATEPEETDPPLPAMDMSGVNVIDGKAEFTFVRAYHTSEVVPPNPENKGTSFSAGEGKKYLVLHLNVTNISSEASSIDDLFKVYFYNEDFGSGTMYAVVEPDQHRLDRSYRLNANESALVYFMVRCPDTTDLSKMYIEVASDTNAYLGEADFSSELSYKEETPKFAKGDVITSQYEGNAIAGKPGTTFTVTVQDIYASDTLYPPNATGVYTYWPDQADSQYVIVKLSVKNTGTADLSYWNMAGVSCKNSSGEKYEASLVTEVDGGQDLELAMASMNLAPQEEAILYFAMMVPNAYAGGPLEISMYVSSDLYTCSFTA